MTEDAAQWTQGGADALPDLTFTNFMIKTCRITDLLPSIAAKHERAIRDLDPIALVEPHLRRRQFREQAA